MRIGMVCPYSFDVHGGVQSHVLQLAEVMHSRGHEVSVVTGTEASSASSRPHSSSTQTTPCRERSGVKRAALARKYSRMPPWKSRWSWERLVNSATS